jgi:hypothetical protein
MGNQLKPGGPGSPVNPDVTPPEFVGSMAQAIETALNNLLPGEDRPQVPTDNSPETRDRRTMFLAIAQGIVNHLVENQAAFEIQDNLGNPLPVKIVIKTV